jgi:hypothetical protein
MGEQSMSRPYLLGIGCGLMIGLVIGVLVLPGFAVAQGAPGTIGLYQIQIANGLPQSGTSNIWRVNTATGALDFCTFVNVTVSGGSHVACQGNPGAR